ncbi:hypothetical protein QBZ16_005337 [Prototheca wickerhamii]|uniref:Enoyl-CoA hydratase n=1 Tax=Prototheca wickerhamii TaxID=3111 RepID=A0AAD9MHB6_PROWI|nr:hypothetical protein QBZ16_005337 [Prototheca wickerhamii]
MSVKTMPTLTTLAVDLQPSKQGTIAWLTINRPEALNALSGELLREFALLMDYWSHPYSLLDDEAALPKDHPRVIILQSAGGKAFSSGVDIKASSLGIGGKSWDYYDIRSQQLLSRLIEKIRAMPQPFIAAVDGFATGGGLALALASDIRVATKKSHFSAAFVRLGLTGSDMGTSFFAPRIAGFGLASEMLLTGRLVTAERAYQVGMLNDLVDDAAALKASALSYANDMLACSYKITKEQLNAAADGMSLRATVTAENSHQILLVNDPVAAAQGNAWLDHIAQKSGKQRPRKSKL